MVSSDTGRELFPDKVVAMTRPEDVARLALDLPNSASLAELWFNCSDGEIF